MGAVAAKATQEKKRGAGEAGSPAPFLKWAGGKTRLLAQFEPFFPERIGRYAEPFVGSAAVFFHLAQRRQPSNVVLSDSNEELINVYRVVRDDVERLIPILERHRRSHGKAHYYRVRAVNPENLAPTARAARLIYLNKTCYNGLYRVNARGEFNVPMGSYKNPKIFDAENLRRVSRALQGVDIRVRHFEAYVDLAKRGDFFYFDPPYHPISATSSFTSYTTGNFMEADQERLAEVYRALDRKGCRLMLSNSDCAFIRGLYRGFRLETVRARRAINSNGGGRGEITELLVLND
ncbi:MAG: DNA adenine methylase [Nitrospinota bacterium]